MTVWSSKKAPGYVSLVDGDGNVIGTDANPLKTSGSGGGGGTQDVNITGQTAGLATAAGQQDIVDAIQALGGGDTSSAIYSGTANVTTTSAALTAQAIGEAIIQNDADSTNDIFIGNNTAQDWRIKPGEWVSVKVSNLNLIYAKTSTGTATLRYFARSAAGISGGGGSPVPVELTGSNVQKNDPLAAGFTVAAGASARAAILNTDGFKRFTCFAEETASASHQFQLGYIPRSAVSGGRQLLNTVTFAPAVTSTRAMLGDNVVSPATDLWIKNLDNVAHTYNVTAYAFPN